MGQVTFELVFTDTRLTDQEDVLLEDNVFKDPLQVCEVLLYLLDYRIRYIWPTRPERMGCNADPETLAHFPVVLDNPGALPRGVDIVHNIVKVKQIKDKLPCDRWVDTVIEPVRLPPEQRTELEQVTGKPLEMPDNADE